MGIFDEVGGSLRASADAALHSGVQSAIAEAANSTTGGLAGLVQRLRDGGLGEHIDAWVAGSHLPVSAEQIKGVLSDDRIATMASAAGMTVSQVLSGLSNHLPSIVKADTENR